MKEMYVGDNKTAVIDVNEILYISNTPESKEFPYQIVFVNSPAINSNSSFAKELINYIEKSQAKKNFLRRKGK